MMANSASSVGGDCWGKQVGKVLLCSGSVYWLPMAMWLATVRTECCTKWAFWPNPAGSSCILMGIKWRGGRTVYVTLSSSNERWGINVIINTKQNM